MKINEKLLIRICYKVPALLHYGLRRKFSKQVANHDINSTSFQKSYLQMIINMERLIE